MIDIFSLFKGIIVVLFVCGGIMLFELLLLFQGIKYYKTGELIVGTRTQDIFWREDKTTDFHNAILLTFLGILFFVLFTFVLTLVEGTAGIILPILHGVIIITLVYWYWKKKELEANQIGKAESG